MLTQEVYGIVNKNPNTTLSKVFPAIHNTPIIMANIDVF
jgi:hypothetical protein